MSGQSPVISSRSSAIAGQSPVLTGRSSSSQSPILAGRNPAVPGQSPILSNRNSSVSSRSPAPSVRSASINDRPSPPVQVKLSNSPSALWDSVIRPHWATLVSQMKPLAVRDLLYQNELLTREQYVNVPQKGERTVAASFLLRQLSQSHRNSPPSVYKLVHVLSGVEGHEQLAALLQRQLDLFEKQAGLFCFLCTFVCLSCSSALFLYFLFSRVSCMDFACVVVLDCRLLTRSR